MFEFCVKKLDSNYNFNIYKVSTLNNPINNSMIFINKNKKELLEKLKGIKQSIIILKKGLISSELEGENLVIYSENPRYKYAEILTEILIFNKKPNQSTFVNGYCFGDNLMCSKNVVIESFVKIGKNVTIGEGTIIKAGAIIGDNVLIGKNCYIRENSVIGGEGFGIETDGQGNNFRIPHIGGVNIGNNVEIGALTTVCSGTIEPTIIEDFVKIDDHVHIAHNVKIDKNSIITAGSIICGSVKVGNNTWISPNSTIINGCNIGNRSVVGLGARVLEDVAEGETVMNEGAENIKKALRFKKIKNEMINGTTRN